MALSSKSPFEVSDFSGGITDKDFDTSKTNDCDILDNFNVTPDKKVLTRAGSVIDDTAHSPILSGNKRIGCLVNYAKNDKLFVQSEKKVFYRSGSGTGVYTTLQGPASNDLFTAGDGTNAPAFAEWNKQLFMTSDAFPTLMKIYKDGSGNYQLRNAGMPAIAAPTVTLGAAGANNYVYAFLYTYTYTVMTQTFKELGATTLVTLAAAAAPNVNPVGISAIPVLTNAGSMNYDTTVIAVEIYRTINNGTNFYKVGQVTNGTTVFTDNVSDTTLQTNQALYINDGTLDYAAPPQAKFIHVVGNVGFLGYTKDASGEHPYRIQQSNPGNVNFWPTGFTLDMEEEVKGVKSVLNLPIALCTKKIFRIDGLFDSYGRNGMSAVKIHDSAGCVSHLSCVEAEGMLYWCGNDGVYTTDGYKVFKVSDHLNTRYANFLSSTTSQKRIYGKFDSTNRRIYWCVEANSANLENDSLFVLDLRWGISTEMTFYTWSGTSFRPTALEIFNDFLYRGDNNGFVFQHSSTYTTDPRVDTVTSTANWVQETIVWTYLSSQINFGSSFFRKFVSRILLQAGNVGDTTIQITAINDQGKKSRDLKLIRWRRNFVWRSDTVVWRNADCVWNATGLIDQWRRMPAKGLRLSYLQVKITNGLGIIANSDTWGTAVIDPVAKTAVLSGGNTWPTQSVGYYLTLPNDLYTRQYLVTAINGAFDTLTLSDTGNNLPAAGTYKWELFGQAKGEPLNLLGYNVHWDNIDQNAVAYHASDVGGNA